MVMDVVEIQKILPHRFPFLLIDRVLELEEGKSIYAYKNVSISEGIFQGHFPGHPIYPGVMIVEGMAQAGGLLAFHSLSEEDKADIENKVVYFMSIDNCKFRAPVRPGDRLEYRLSVTKHRGNVWMLKGEAFVDGKLTTEADLKAMIVDK